MYINILLTQVSKATSLISRATPQGPWNHPCSLWAAQRLCVPVHRSGISFNTHQVSGPPDGCCKLLRNPSSLAGAVRFSQLTDVEACIETLWERAVLPTPGQVTLNNRLLITCDAAKKAVVFVPDAVIQEKRCRSPPQKCMLCSSSRGGSAPNTVSAPFKAVSTETTMRQHEEAHNCLEKVVALHFLWQTE